MFKVLEGCKSPERATRYSAAIDLFAAEDKIIKAGETAKVRLGVCINHETILDWVDTFYPLNEGMLPKHKMDYFLKTNYLQLEPRSSLRAKGLIAGTGIIDLDYKDEIMIILHNPNRAINISINEDEPNFVFVDNSFMIKKGEKIAQIMLCEHKSWLLGYKSETERISGFGSTGK